MLSDIRAMLVNNLTLSYGDISHSLSVPAPIGGASAKIVDEFISSLPPSLDAVDDYSAQTTRPSSDAELLALFLHHVALKVRDRRDEGAETQSPEEKLLELIIKDFEATFLKTRGIHSVVASLPGTAKQHVAIVQAYHESVAVAGSAPRTTESALFSDAAIGKATIYGVFGGQGLTVDVLEELRTTYTVYPSLVTEFLESISRLLSGLVQDARAGSIYEPFGLDILGWLEQPALQPDKDYLISAPVSMPLIGVLTLCRYRVLSKSLGKTPDEIRKSLSGVTGHSQGIVAAAAAAAAESWEDFDRIATDCITVLFWIGLRCQQEQPQFRFTSSEIEDAYNHNEGYPSPMLSVRGLSQEAVRSHLSVLNAHLPDTQKLHISLINSNDNMVVSGPPRVLKNLNVRLRKFNASPDVNQTRIPYSKRKAAFVHEYLPITVPFHSPYLTNAFRQILVDVADIFISKDDLALPIFATDTGKDLREHAEPNIVPELVRMIVQEPVNWPQASKFHNATHVLDFGPGGLSGVTALLKNAKQGSGTRILLASDIAGPEKAVGYLSEILDSNPNSVHYESSWAHQYGPKLAQTSSGKVYVDTKLSRLLGLPPVLVAGMTPTTVSWDFVAATMNAGYQIELAGGGYWDTRTLTDAIEKVIEHCPRGRGVTCNFIYINPQAITWQIAMVRQLLAKGINIEGITIGAGVPSLEVAHQYVELGLKHISFKPGSTEAILQVIAIAQAHPEFPVILQWTGGRGGGHHSAEDFHQPLLSTYGRIRQHKNLMLVVGSGFGGAEDTYPYLTGAWSTKYSYPAMPVDGIMLGSRLMVAKEAHTSIEAKNAIVAAPGVDDGSWDATYDGEAGGVITVQSEMGEAIHKIATRGTRFWAEMDRTIFSLERGKRLAVLNQKKPYIIQKLNNDFQKPWFGRNSSGPADLEDMTYLEVLERAIELLYVKHQSRWVDISLERPVKDFVHRIEQRFSVGNAPKTSLQNAFEKPLELVGRIRAVYPETGKELMKHEDVRYFLSIFRRFGQKPAPFVPCMDDDFDYWFKKDSLWQSEDVQAVVGQDVQRTCILQGPVAVKYSKVADEPVKSILDGIHIPHTQWLLNDVYSGKIESVPRVEYFGDVFGDQASEDVQHTGFEVFESNDKVAYTIGSSPDLETLNQKAWIDLLAGQERSWRRALFTSKSIVQDKVRVANSILRLFAPRENIEVEILHPDEPQSTVITLKEKSPHRTDSVVELRSNADSQIHVSLFAKNSAQADGTKLTLIYDYRPDAGYALITESLALRTQQIKDFYYRLWFGEEKPELGMPLSHIFVDENIEVSRSTIEQYTSSIGGQHRLFGLASWQNHGQAPLDLGILLGWKVLMKPLFLDAINGDLLSLVHLSNEFRLFPGADPLKEGDIVDASSRISSVTINDAGKVVTVIAVIRRQNIPVVELTSAFQYRGVYKDYESAFQEQDEPPLTVTFNSESDIAVLRSKPWFIYDGKDETLLNTRLKFELHTSLTYKSMDTWSSLHTAGEVFAESANKSFVPIASVKYDAGESRKNPVLEYLARKGQPYDKIVNLDNPVPLNIGDGSLTFAVPSSNIAYAHASYDYNPIHVSRSFSQLAGLPGTITHGMHTSAIVRNLIELNVPGCDVPSFRRFSCSFVGMVLPKDTLEAKVEHVAMTSGRKLYRVTVTNIDTGERVLQGEAEIDQPETVYIFTGQGSQAQNMGMDLYNRSPVVKALWDQIDKYMLENFGL